MTIERTRDAALIKQIATDPSVFPHISDDHHPDPAAWQPIMNELAVYLVARDAGGVLGLGIFVARTRTVYEAHVAFLRRGYGATALDAFRRMIGWMWKHTTAARLVGEIALENRLAIRFATRAGFKAYGLNAKSLLRGGVLRDQLCLGISRL